MGPTDVLLLVALGGVVSLVFVGGIVILFIKAVRKK